MALNVYFDDGVQARLVSCCVAALAAAATSGVPDVSYCRGCVDNCRAVGLSFGLRWPDVLGEVRVNLRAVGVLDLLDQAGAGLLQAGR